MTRVLYYHPQSNFSRKIRILLAEKNIEHSLKAVDLRNKDPEFLKISPIGRVPVFLEEDSTLIWDSTLIAEYLDETYPEPRFYPQDTKARIECRKWEELADNLGENIINLWVLNLKKNLIPTFYRTKLERSINRLVPIFDKQLSQSQYLLSNDTWTAADVAALCSFGYYSLRLNEDWLLEYPNLKNWFNHLHERESVKSTVPIGFN